VKRGRLIYFAGLDGSGKTTQAHRAVSARGGWVYRWARWEPALTDPLMKLGRSFLRRGQGSGRPADDVGHRDFVAGKRGLFRRPWLRATWTTLVLLEYLPQMAWRLLPVLFSGRTVVCDRYVPDVWIDLAMNYDEGFEGVERLSRHPLSRLFPRPDHVILLDLPAQLGFERKQDGTPLAYLQEREPLYVSLPHLFPTTVVDARDAVDEVARNVGAALDVLG
jgi:thymidylate kinase